MGALNVPSLGSVTRRRLLVIVLIAAVAGAGWWVHRTIFPDYREYRLSVPAASGLEPLMDVRIGGTVAGRIQDIHLEGGRQPVITLGVDRDAPPLREDAEAVIEYKSLLGERYIAISPGSEDLPELSEGALLTSDSERVDIDQVLQVLDDERREHLVRLIGNARVAVEDRGDQLNTVLDGAGPAVANTSEVLSALGEDQEAVRQLVTSTSKLVGELSEQRDEVGRIVERTSAGLRGIARESDALAEGLQPLPDTLRSVRSTLDELETAVDATVPMLQDLRPVAAELPGLATELRPMMPDLRHTIEELQPALATAPPLLDDLTGVLDEQLAPVSAAGTSVLDQAVPIVDFLRPYSPEVAGWASNWAGAALNYDSDGYYLRVPGMFNLTSVMGSPVNLAWDSLPGSSVAASRAPGHLEGQPIEGANVPPEALR